MQDACKHRQQGDNNPWDSDLQSCYYTIELAGSISQSVRQLIAGIDMTILYFDTNDGIDTELWVLILLSIDLIRTTRDMAFS